MSGGRGGAYGASKNAALRRLKPYNRPDGRGKCTPSVAFGDISPGGEMLAALCIEWHKKQWAEWRAKSPSGGKVVRQHQRGGISNRRSLV